MMGLLLGGVLLLLWMPAPALVISEETTRITGPLTAEGQIDFFKALEQRMMPPEFATDENGFRIFVRTFGDVSETANWEFYRLQKYEKLGLDPDVPPTLTFPRDPREIIRDFREAQGEEVPNWRLINIGEQPWTLEECPVLADWINEIDEPLNAIAEMIRKPVFLPPLYQSQESIETGKPESLFALLLPDVQGFRDIARMFQARAAYRIGQGNIDGAIDDKLTVHRFGRLVAQKSCLVQVLVGIACEAMAAAIPINANPEHPLTEQQIRRLLDGLDALPPRTSLHDAYEWERISGLSEVQSVIRGERWSGLDLASFVTLPDGTAYSYDINNDPGLWVLNYVSIDQNVVYRRMNEVYDALHEPSPRARLDLLFDQALTNWRPNAWGSRIWTPGGRADILADFFITTSFPATDSAKEVIRRMECADNLQRLALAILLYELEHGEMPGENWTTQIEKYLGGDALGDGQEQYFSCPANPAPKGFTTYALIQYGDMASDTVAGSLMLVELAEAVPFAEAVITVDEVLERSRLGSMHTSRTGGMNVVHRSGAVLFMPQTIAEEELMRMLGREKFDPQIDAD